MRRFTAVAWCRFARQSRPHRTARRTTPIGSEPSRLSIPLPRWRCVASEGCVLVQGRGLLRGENARQITPPGAPLSERVMLWRRISAMFRARCALPQDKYEPYVVLRTGDMTPAYDERFSDYGMNKITHTIEVRGPAHGQRLLMSLFAACRCLSLVLFVLLANSLFAVSLSVSLSLHPLPWNTTRMDASAMGCRVPLRCARARVGGAPAPRPIPHGRSLHPRPHAPPGQPPHEVRSTVVPGCSSPDARPRAQPGRDCASSAPTPPSSRRYLFLSALQRRYGLNGCPRDEQEGEE